MSRRTCAWLLASLVLGACKGEEVGERAGGDATTTDSTSGDTSRADARVEDTSMADTSVLDSTAAVDTTFDTTDAETTTAVDTAEVSIDTPPTSRCTDFRAGTNAMVELVVPKGVSGLDKDYTYCIDEKEVTVGQFNALVLDPAPFDAPSFCAGARRPARETDPLKLNKPMVIAWCQSFAYCKWAGKRLCGQIGGGHETSSAVAVSEWTYACANGNDQTIWPYGDIYDMTACNTEKGDAGYAPLDDVGSRLRCHGRSSPFDKIFDMSGNVAEYVDSAGAYSWGGAHARGGWAGARYERSSVGERATDCYDSGDDLVLTTEWGNQGFRCCDDPK
jgi:formylglycine-generating enzyme